MVNSVREKEDSDCEGKHRGSWDAGSVLLLNLVGSDMDTHIVDN